MSKKNYDQSGELPSQVIESIPTLVDPFTGEEFRPRSRHHYEFNDGKPVAPPVNTPRLSLRQRVERLLAGGVDLSQGIYEDNADEWDDDDAEDPLTPAERAYTESFAARDRIMAAGKPKPPAATPSEVPAEPMGEASNPPADGPPNPGPTGSKSP